MSYIRDIFLPSYICLVYKAYHGYGRNVLYILHTLDGRIHPSKIECSVLKSTRRRFTAAKAPSLYHCPCCNDVGSPEKPECPAGAGSDREATSSAIGWITSWFSTDGEWSRRKRPSRRHRSSVCARASVAHSSGRFSEPPHFFGFFHGAPGSTTLFRGQVA